MDDTARAADNAADSATDQVGPFTPEHLASASAAGFRVRWVADTGSTNADLVEAARSGEPDGAVLVADHQRAGRGRLDRRWVAPPGASLLTSILLRRPELGPDDVPLVVSAVAVSAAAACADHTGIRPGLKWPNDLVIGSGAQTRKVGGILAEAVVVGGAVEAVVVGLGCNVRWPQDLPDELDGVATALNHHSERCVTVPDLLVTLLEHLGPTVDGLSSERGRGSLLDLYRRSCSTLGQAVRVELGKETLTGTAVDLDARGRLVVETADGGRTVVNAGDVVHLRPQ
ncbi:MAG: biotin--[acetyl-CoA-carboxylase] ligase [Acidimicrobiia bacterium]|nr:biotin--[acetyl-CoA-carboxylase] ligase [Acidimicrobiia bacterium]